MSTAAPGDRARVTVGVAVPPAQAFRIFTEQIEQWWRRGPRFRHSRGDSGLIALEPKVGGRVFESFDVDGTPHVVEIGRIRIWQPPQRLLFDWQVAQGTALERTEVEVLFEAVGDHGTRVTVTHRGWAAIRADHPARHGRVGSEFSRELGLWWGDLLAAWRLHCAQAGR
ncbi:MAG TPA: SRPBCC domain-containing protein [Burkholderiaceae bacterium]|nr:SRPBCC domain-containing protein [Burkholderiaceae bacterium]